MAAQYQRSRATVGRFRMTENLVTIGIDATFRVVETTGHFARLHVVNVVVGAFETGHYPGLFAIDKVNACWTPLLFGFVEAFD